MHGAEGPQESSWMRRFLTCEAFDGDVSVDRERLLGSALPLLLWSAVMAVVYASGLRLGIARELNVGILAPLAVTLTCHWLVGDFDPARPSSPLTRAYKTRLDMLGILVGIAACRWLEQGSEPSAAGSRLLLAPLFIALCILPVHAWARIRWLEPYPPARRFVRAALAIALLLALFCILGGLPDWL